MATIFELRKKSEQILLKAGIENARFEAEELIAFCMDTKRSRLFNINDVTVEEKVINRLDFLLKQRTNRIPLQYIIGTAPFFGLELIVNSSVLIPRFETEILVEETLKVIKSGMKILDICTGSGCIPIALATSKTGSECIYTACDISNSALEVAQLNAKKYNVNIQFIESDVTLSVTKDTKFDIITANPPYIKSSKIHMLSSEVKDHDPLLALDGGEDGLDVFRRLAKEIPCLLADEGSVFLEIGYDQGKSVPALFSEVGYRNIRVLKDYAGHDRVVIVKG